MWKDYKSNTGFSQEEIAKITVLYKLAGQAGDMKTRKEMSTYIYQFIEKYVYSIMWKKYANIMQSPYREDVLQDIWVSIFSEMKRYDPAKGAMTVFVNPWIKHAVSEHASRRFSGTSAYYASVIKKIDGAEEYIRQNGLQKTPKTICALTGLAPATVDSAIDMRNRKGNVSYENLTSSGFEEASRWKGPEEQVIAVESEEEFHNIMLDTLSPEEYRIACMLLNPAEEKTIHSSYRAIAKALPGMNIPKVKKIASQIPRKLLKNPGFRKRYPWVVQQEKLIADGDIGVLDIDREEDEEFFREFVASKEG